MSNKNLTGPTTEPSDPCPSLEQWAAYLRQELTEAAAGACARHLESCADCRLVIESDLSSPELSASLVWLTEADFAKTSGLVDLPGQDPGEVSHSPLRIVDGRFQLLRTLGMGGCGTVFAAWDQLLRRHVALKIPHWTLCENPLVRQRFSIEARAAARLSHVNIVPVYEAKIRETGDCYLVTELIEGPSLEVWHEQHLALNQQVPPRHAAQLLQELATGVHSAHLAKVLHRDLKPSNVMLARAPDRESGWTPRITDFGLARLSEAAAATTLEGGVFGSVQYMAPEQATGQTRVDPACDIYALGVILYELLTGRLPIEATSVAATLAAIPLQPVDSPRLFRKEIPRDLAAICLKCLEKRPEQRHHSAAALAEELRRFLNGEPVQSRLPSPSERMARWVRRNPAPTLVFTTLLMATTAVVSILVSANASQKSLIAELQEQDRELESSNEQLQVSNERLNSALVTAGQMRRKAEAQQSATQERLYASECRRAIQAWHDRDLSLTHMLTDKLDAPEFAPFRGVEVDWLKTQLYDNSRPLTQFLRAVYSLCFTPDGKQFAAAGRDATIRILHFPSGQVLREWPTGQGEVNGLAFSADGQLLWSSGDDGSLVQWNVATGQSVRRVSGHAPEQAHNLLAAGPDRTRLVSVGTDSRILIHDLVTGELLKAIHTEGGRIYSAALLDSGRRLIVSNRRDLSVWDLNTYELVSHWLDPSKIMAILPLRGDEWLLLSRDPHRLEVRNARSGKTRDVVVLPDDVDDLLKLPVSGRILGIDRRGTVYELELPADLNSEVPVSFHPVGWLSGGQTSASVISPRGDDLVLATKEGQVRCVKVDTLLAGRASELELVAEYLDLDVSLVGDSLVACDSEGLLEVSLARRKSRRVPASTGRRTDQVVNLPQGELLTVEVASGSLDGTASLPSGERREWLVRRDAADLRSIQEIDLKAGPMSGGFHLDPQLGLLFIERSAANAGSSWFKIHLESGSVLPLHKFNRGTMPSAYCAARSLLIVCDLNDIVAFDVVDCSEIWRRRLPASATCLATSANGRFVAAATEQRVVEVWRAENGTHVSSMQGHRHRPRCLTFSTDGRTLFSGDDGGDLGSELRCWQVSTGEPLGIVLQSEDTGFSDVALTKSDWELIVVNGRGKVSLTSLKPRAEN